MANPSDPEHRSAPTTDPRRLSDVVLDALVYAPIGLTLDGQELAPELARRGRQHAAAARQIGEFAVKAGLRRLDGALASRIAADQAEAPAPPRPGSGSATDTVADADADASGDVSGDDTPSMAAGAEGETAAGEHTPANAADASETTPSSEHLAIPDYDLLAASQVVRRLDGLDADQLEAVRVYESATRDRRTILHKIARIQG